MPKKITVQVDDSESRHREVQARLVSEIEVVAIDELHVDREMYQRKLVQSRVDKIARSYDMAVAGIITVNRRSNGLLYIVDGQHRTFGAKKAGEVEMLAQVYQGLTRDQESWLYDKKNSTHGPMSATARYKARLSHGDQIAVNMRDVAEELGLHINTERSPTNGINAVSAVEYIYCGRKTADHTIDHEAAKERTRMVLSIIRDAFGKQTEAGVDLPPKAAHGDLMKAIFHFCAVHEGQYDRKRLVRKLGEYGPERIQVSAGDFRRAYSMDGGYINWYRAVLNRYNSGRQDPSKRLMEA